MTKRNRQCTQHTKHKQNQNESPNFKLRLTHPTHVFSAVLVRDQCFVASTMSSRDDFTNVTSCAAHTRAIQIFQCCLPRGKDAPLQSQPRCKPGPLSREDFKADATTFMFSLDRPSGGCVQPCGSRTESRVEMYSQLAVRKALLTCPEGRSAWAAVPGWRKETRSVQKSADPACARFQDTKS